MAWTSVLATTASRVSWLRCSTRSARARSCPPERDLAVRLGASRNAVRDRLQMLEGLGVLRRRQGAGTFVQLLQPKGLTLALDLALVSISFSIEALQSVRVAMERQVVREAAQAQDPIAIAHIRKAVDDMTHAESSRDIDVADVAFHQALMHATGNPVLTFFADAMTSVWRRAVLKRRALLSQYPADKSVSGTAHQPLYEAIYAVWHELFDTLSLEDL